MGHRRTTSAKVASKAGRALAGKRISKLTKTLAAAALGHRRKKH